jgi:metallophosphoesterase superfamily enzyme
LVSKPSSASSTHVLADGVVALPDGLALLTASRVLLCADAHLGYEEVMGAGAVLPLWSTSEIVALLIDAAARTRAREIVFLGDAIHGAAMSAGAGRAIGSWLGRLRACAPVTVIAGNHEGRSRGAAILGASVERCERDGWTLSHGDRPEPSSPRTIIGHLHPALHVGGRSVPAFLAAARLVVVPATTPYSRGLDVRSRACADALTPWGVTPRDVQVVATTSERVFPFGSLAALRALRRG